MTRCHATIIIGSKELTIIILNRIQSVEKTHDQQIKIRHEFLEMDSRGFFLAQIFC